MKTPKEIKKGLKACDTGDCGSKRHGCPYRKEDECTGVLAKDALAYINQLENHSGEATKMVTPTGMAQKWISVNERLPDKSIGWVLVAMQFAESGRGYAVPNIAELRNGKWHLMDNKYSPEQLGLVVSHWMHLPEPPRKENGGELA